MSGDRLAPAGWKGGANPRKRTPSMILGESRGQGEEEQPVQPAAAEALANAADRPPPQLPPRDPVQTREQKRANRQSVSSLGQSIGWATAPRAPGRQGGLLGKQRDSRIPEEPMPAKSLNASTENVKASRDWKRTKVLQELLETEKSFVTQLHQLMELYHNRIAGAAVLEHQQVEMMFQGVQQVEGTHTAFLADLEAAIESEEPLANACVGQVFLSFMTVFRPTHRQFVKYKAESMAMVQKLLDSNESFAALLERCGDDTHYGRMGLDSRMQAPIQRVPRYILMLKDLRKYTGEDHPDYSAVCEALMKMISTADSINEARRMAECQVKMQALDAAMVGNRASLRASQEIDSKHDWSLKPTKVPTFCGYCKSFIPGLRKMHTECSTCGVVCHSKCASNMTALCGIQETLIHPQRLFISEFYFMHRAITQNKGKSASDRVSSCKLLVFTDSVLVLYDADEEKPECVCLIRWYSQTKERPMTLVDSSEFTFTITAPRTGTIHTFTTRDADEKRVCITDINNQMMVWLENENTRSRYSTAPQRGRAPTLNKAAAISFTINATVPVSSHGKIFTAYVIDVDDPYGTRTVLKRYSEFDTLYRALKETIEKKYMPKLPAKRRFGNNMSDHFIQRRCRGLQNFLNQVVKLPGTVQNPVFQEFLHASDQSSRPSSSSSSGSHSSDASGRGSMDTHTGSSDFSHGSVDSRQDAEESTSHQLQQQHVESVIQGELKEQLETEQAAEEEGEPAPVEDEVVAGPVEAAAEEDDAVFVEATELGGVVLFDFDPNSLVDNAHGVAVNEGERVTIISMETEPWWYVSTERGTSGYVPMSYIQADEPAA